jgi:hypothetical protein
MSLSVSTPTCGSCEFSLCAAARRTYQFVRAALTNGKNTNIVCFHFFCCMLHGILLIDLLAITFEYPFPKFKLQLQQTKSVWQVNIIH